MSYKIHLPNSGIILEGYLTQKCCPYCIKDKYASASTSLTTLCCDTHLDTVYGLTIEPCRAFPKKGLGLYATREFKTSEIIARTRGNIINSDAELNSIYGTKEDCAPYTISVALPRIQTTLLTKKRGFNKFVDELVDRSPCAYANDPTDIDHFNYLISKYGMSAREAYDRSLLLPETENAYMSAEYGLRPVLYAMRDIKPGEEILWRYGHKYWE